MPSPETAVNVDRLEDTDALACPVHTRRFGAARERPGDDGAAPRTEQASQTNAAPSTEHPLGPRSGSCERFVMAPQRRHRGRAARRLPSALPTALLRRRRHFRWSSRSDIGSSPDACPGSLGGSRWVTRSATSQVSSPQRSAGGACARPCLSSACDSAATVECGCVRSPRGSNPTASISAASTSPVAPTSPA
jgi:hypothetical protein